MSPSRRRRRGWVPAVTAVLVLLATTMAVVTGTPAFAAVGGCSASTWVMGFKVSACINDQNTGVVGYPDGYVDFAPNTGNCHIQIQLWDDQNRQYSNQTVPCTSGHYTGQSASVSSATTLHAYARADLGDARFAVGDSPAVRLGQGITSGQGGCNSPDYHVQGFSIGVCVNDRHTGTTAYSDIYVSRSPLDTCAVRIQSWDDNNTKLSDLNADDPCSTGHHVGANVTRISPTVRAHPFTRICVSDGCSGVDGPTITLGAYNTVPAANWRAHFTAGDQGDVINVVLSRSSTVGMPALIAALSTLQGRNFGVTIPIYLPWTQVYGTTTPLDTGGWPAGKCINWLTANVQSSGGSPVQQQYSMREGGCSTLGLTAYGVDHFRAWQQSSTTAWFIAASTEHVCNTTHCIVSYNDGRDFLVAAIRQAAAASGWSVRTDNATPYGGAGSVTNPDGSTAPYDGHVTIITLH